MAVSTALTPRRSPGCRSAAEISCIRLPFRTLFLSATKPGEYWRVAWVLTQ